MAKELSMSNQLMEMDLVAMMGGINVGVQLILSYL